MSRTPPMSTTFDSSFRSGTRPPARVPTAARLLLAIVSRLAHGQVEIVGPDGTTWRFGPGGAPGEGLAPHPAVLRVHDWRMASAALKGGDVGFGESYMAGHWDSPDLVQLLTVLAANQAAIERAYHGRRFTQAVLRLKHWFNTNTRRQARRNIAAHYDLGNDFYALWLDRSMTYSSALFEGDAARPLEVAQDAKYRRMVDELALAPGSHVLEIGCGWGGFAETAARAGHRVTGISLSAEQTAYARDRLAAAGLADRVDLALRDYRDLDGRHDAVASIEMFEAVGEKYWPGYFAAVRDALVPGGRACIQAITIAGDRFERYRTQSDFIQQYIFPGGMLAPPARIVDEARSAGLVLERDLAFGRDYAETLKRWLAAFDHHAGAIAQRFDAAFVRCWRFYLAYCAAGFDTRTTDVHQFTFRRP